MSAPKMVEKVKEIYAAQRDATAAHDKLSAVLRGGPASFYYEKMDEYIEGLLSFSKFKIGDHVALTHDIDCNDKPGWSSSAHFLKAGRGATVQDLDWNKGRFTYGVVFDVETYIYPENEPPKPVKDDQRHQFWFAEPSLRAA